VTARGLELAKSGETINNDLLRRYPEFRAFQARTRVDRTEGISIDAISSDEPPTRHTPDETLDSVYQTLRNTLALDLLERLKQGSPQFFEEAVIDVLLAMGCGGSQRDAARRVGQSGDGGIDGIINEDRLGLDVVYIHAKRWQGTVGARDVRDFAGSLEEKKALKGVFITTSDFTRDARDFVGRIGKRIVLIDGEELAQLLIDFNIGVSARKTYVIKKIDEDYFSDE
jgi:restriction system protein